MGKKAKFKKMRNIAREMPEINRQDGYRRGEKVTGQSLIEKGVIVFPDGRPVDPLLDYYPKEANVKPMNHYKQMKKQYKAGGIAAVNDYTVAVKTISETQNQ